MLLKPIPRILLGHSCSYYARKSIDENGISTFDTKIDITFVRFETIRQSANRMMGEMKDDKLKMYYDLNNSNPNTVTFNELDKVVYNSKDYTVRVVEIYDKHHLEVYLK
jgi:hypothetical protein